MNIVESLQEAINKRDWTLVEDVCRTLGGTFEAKPINDDSEESLERQKLFEIKLEPTKVSESLSQGGKRQMKGVTLAKSKPKLPTTTTKVDRTPKSIVNITCVKCGKTFKISQKLVTEPYKCNNCITQR